MANQKEIMLQNVTDEIKKYCEQIAYLEDLFELQRELGPIEEDEKCLVGVRLINSALYDAAFITIAKLVSDNDNQTKSIWKLVERIRKNIFLFDDEKRRRVLNCTDACEKKLQVEYGGIVNKIKTRRDTLIAHNDNKYFVKMEKYTERIPNYELWIVSGVVKNYLCSLVQVLDISASTTGKYVECQDLRKIIERRGFRE